MKRSLMRAWGRRLGPPSTRRARGCRPNAGSRALANRERDRTTTQGGGIGSERDANELDVSSTRCDRAAGAKERPIVYKLDVLGSQHAAGQQQTRAASAEKRAAVGEGETIED